MKGNAIVVICLGFCALASSYVLNEAERDFMLQKDVIEYLEDEMKILLAAKTGCTCAETCKCTAPIGKNETADITLKKADDTVDGKPCITLTVKVGAKVVFETTAIAAKFYHRNFVYDSAVYYYQFVETENTDNKLTGHLKEIYPKDLEIGDITLP